MPLEIQEDPTVVEKAKMIELLEVDTNRVFRPLKGESSMKFHKKPYDKPQISY